MKCHAQASNQVKNTEYYENERVKCSNDNTEWPWCTCYQLSNARTFSYNITKAIIIIFPLDSSMQLNLTVLPLSRVMRSIAHFIERLRYMCVCLFYHTMMMLTINRQIFIQWLSIQPNGRRSGMYGLVLIENKRSYRYMSKEPPSFIDTENGAYSI